MLSGWVGWHQGGWLGFAAGLRVGSWPNEVASDECRQLEENEEMEIQEAK